MGHQKTKTPTNIYLPDDLHRRLQLVKINTGMSVSAIIEKLVALHLDAFLDSHAVPQKDRGA